MVSQQYLCTIIHTACNSNATPSLREITHTNYTNVTRSTKITSNHKWHML